ncbi:hypothetical protein GOEFS_059_00330 [Gordonia effusa NBRC 100432]|uniref:DUF2752 domain-containing protein n=1 Tax=Gordonia effusa NBRC 100432 TaxID=1077974 RepID=H0R0J8_9ACTN|nr:DUF2752 domain-containing protein [Gordonia effusa]GAB18599.1 hypothetical protein GOEFS_059_00330 [Gordonia effusa NBRC 100432]
MHPDQPPLVPAERSAWVSALPAVAVFGAGAAIFGIAGAWSPAGVTSGPSMCPFREMTGWPCPACGLTRSFVMLAHGDVSQAFSFNFFGPIFFVVGVVAVVVAGWSLVARRPAVLSRFGSWLAKPATMVVLGLWMAYGVVRIIDTIRGTMWFPTIT